MENKSKSKSRNFYEKRAALFWTDLEVLFWGKNLWFFFSNWINSKWNDWCLIYPLEYEILRLESAVTTCLEISSLKFSQKNNYSFLTIVSVSISLTRLFRIQVTRYLSYDPPFKRVKGCLSNTKLYVILHNLGNVGWNAINCLIIGWSVCRLKESLTDGKIIFKKKSWCKLAFVVGSWSDIMLPN